MQQAPDQGALAVVHVAAGQETQQFFALVLSQISEDVFADQIGLVTHLIQAPSCQLQAASLSAYN